MEVRNFSSELFGATFSGPCTASLNGTCVDKLERIPLLNSLYAYIPHSIFTAVVGVIVYWLFTQVLFDRPPPKGLKHIPGPRSTLPYLGRIHDVDRYDTKNSMKKFNDIYNGLFIITLGGEKHIWVGREDIAFDLLCKNAAICSGRADLGAYPSVTKEAQYLPLLGYNGKLNQLQWLSFATNRPLTSDRKPYPTAQVRTSDHDEERYQPVLRLYLSRGKKIPQRPFDCTRRFLPAFLPVLRSHHGQTCLRVSRGCSSSCEERGMVHLPARSCWSSHQLDSVPAAISRVARTR
jgi:hypothetical protein